MLPRSQIGRLAVAGGLAGTGGGAVVAAGNREPVWGKAAGGAVIGAGLLAGAGVAGTKNGPLARDVAGWRAGWRRAGKLGRILNMKVFETLQPGMIELAKGDRAIAYLTKAGQNPPVLTRDILRGVPSYAGKDALKLRQQRNAMAGLIKRLRGVKSFSGLAPRMIEFAKVDLGEDRDRYLGEVGAMPSAPKKWYPSLHVSGLAKELPLPDEGKATITYKVKRRSSEKYDGKEQHSATIEVQTIETPDSAAKGGLRRGKPGVVKRLFARRGGMIEFSDRPRNGDGQFVANETGGADPNSMAAAYGNVAAEKAARRRSLVQRIKAMFGRGQGAGDGGQVAMSALAPGMVEFGVGTVLRDFAGAGARRSAQVAKEGASINRGMASRYSKMAGEAQKKYRQKRNLDDLHDWHRSHVSAGEFRGTAKRYLREARLWGMLGHTKAQRAAAVGALPVVAGGAYLAGRKRRQQMSALAPGMVEFGRGERSIAALKTIYRNAGGSGKLGAYETASLRKNPANVKRAIQRMWPGDKVTHAEAMGTMEINREVAARLIRAARQQRQ